ncbi:hypothetical protein PAXRUDRAFT_461834 [Paxillus rubicundulus Ve08.2h10]|uniref:Uncharacterized protein n=1 Tax=Paxillus rubicundulus Ve08.2h10 TaxID=930991 RepID=A0A0D0E6T9_9AGAM|nr:hypothetical protein PAXRUDRAFT_461834 [Paxillus rubicundulus Ve08.2h10]
MFFIKLLLFPYDCDTSNRSPVSRDGASLAQGFRSGVKGGEFEVPGRTQIIALGNEIVAEAVG